jgi:hypothetical protein
MKKTKSTSKSTSKLTIKKKVLFSCIILVILAASIEVSFKLFSSQQLYDKCDRNHPDWPRPMTLSDDLLGWKTKPNWTGCFYQHDTNKKVTITINSKGLRTTKEFTHIKPENTFRILVFGDSLLYGQNLDDSETFQAHFQKELQKFTKKTVEIVPFAGAGYNIYQSYLTFKTVGKDYEADLVIFLFSQTDLDEVRSAKDDMYPRPLLYYDGERIIRNSTAKEMYAKLRNERYDDMFPHFNNDYNKKIRSPAWHSRFLRTHSHTFNYLLRKVRQIKKQRKDLDFKRLYEKMRLADEGIFVYTIKEDPSFKEDATLVNLAIDVFRRDVEEQNMPFLLVNIPSRYQTRDEYINVMQKEAKKFDNKKTFSAPKLNFFLNSISKAKKISYIDLTETAYNNQKIFFHMSDGHWSPEGARLAAKKVALELNNQIMSKEQSK